MHACAAQLRDGMKEVWPPDVVADHVAKAVGAASPALVRRGRFMMGALSAAAWACPCPCILLARPARVAMHAQIVTFDSHGVSGHANHTAVYHGVLQYKQQLTATPHAEPPEFLMLRLLVRACTCGAGRDRKLREARGSRQEQAQP
eukprot:364834-Chlamydomonas_euryale.AAC.2